MGKKILRGKLETSMLDARSGVLRNLMTNFGAECTRFHLQTQIIWGKSRIDDVTKKGK